MPTMRLGPNDLLEYDSTYRVLICRDCQYAIQKSAVQSHLLRHKIYRNERHRLVDSITQLMLCEPDDVRLPAPTSKPINILPILSGYRCDIGECRHLCASAKRMTRHQITDHGLSAPHHSSSFSRPVKLQTFFRGTKVRYFEVSCCPTVHAETLSRGEDSDVDHSALEGDIHEADSETHPEPIPSGTVSLLAPVDVDLETLTYFHHFITATSHTLPCADCPAGKGLFWQTYVASACLQHRRSMCGILTISACHLGALAEDPATKQAHRDRATQYSSQFLAECVGGKEETREAEAQIVSLLRCATWTLTGWTNAPHLHTIIQALRIFSASKEDHGQADMFAQVSRTLHTNTGNGTLAAALYRLETLPTRMTELFGRPDSVRDVLATLAAIGALVECCSVSFSSDDDPEVAWRAMAMWLNKIPFHFDQMLSQNNAAALVVLAHWATLLVRRTEKCGCWFLRGSTEAIMLRITEHIAAESHVVRDFIANLDQTLEFQ